ncbi:amino acid permease [Phyllosticta capitalensis]|uniref:Amino acid permease n=1 Tax=Phyllosticta capitalensis TaxID=121624 RepID=A0ABR1YAD8_9PEZI
MQPCRNRSHRPRRRRKKMAGGPAYQLLNSRDMADPRSFKDGTETDHAQVRDHQQGDFAPLHRKLKSRHLQMITIGGIIGPGLLVGSGNALHLAGPGGVLISFSLVGIIVFFVMQSLGELATLIPVTGSFTDYAARFVDESLAFALGWAYWYLWVTVLANEYNSISLVVMYWTDTVPQWAWILIFWVIFISLSMLGVLAYGEVEFWLSLIKVISLTVFFILAIAISAGGIGPQKIGFKYWHDPGAFADSINGVAKTFVIAGTLFAGTEMVGITAGESENPRRAVPRAINQVFWRILIFYIGMMFFIGMLIPYNDKRLLSGSSKTAASPLTIALEDAQIAPAAHLINALIVISVISAGNSSLYVASRTITHMARNGMAPLLLGKTNQKGVPWAALLFTNLAACISFLSQGSGAGVVFEALITLSGVATFIVWATIEVVHIRLRQALKAQEQSADELPFKALWYPYGTYACLAANIFLVFFQGYTAFLNPFSPSDFVINYILIPIFVLFVVVWKFWHKTKFVRAADIDIWSGRREDYGDEDPIFDKKHPLWHRFKAVCVG